MTVSEFCYRVRSRAKMNKADASYSIILDAMNDRINQLVKYVADFYAYSATGTIAASANEVTIPADFLRMLSLNVGDYVYNGIAQFQHRFYNEDARVYWYSSGALSIFPTPTADVAYTLYYTRVPTDVSAVSGAGSTLDFPLELQRDLADLVVGDIADPLTDKIVYREKQAMKNIMEWQNRVPRDRTIKSWVDDERANTFPS